MMQEKCMLKRKLSELKFAIHELELYLDTHPKCQRSLSLLKKYRMAYAEMLAVYEAKYGKLIVTTSDVPAEGSWQWIHGPWPWEINFTEE